MREAFYFELLRPFQTRLSAVSRIKYSFSRFGNGRAGIIYCSGGGRRTA